MLCVHGLICKLHFAYQCTCKLQNIRGNLHAYSYSAKFNNVMSMIYSFCLFSPGSQVSHYKFGISHSSYRSSHRNCENMDTQPTVIAFKATHSALRLESYVPLCIVHIVRSLEEVL